MSTPFQSTTRKEVEPIERTKKKRKISDLVEKIKKTRQRDAREEDIDTFIEPLPDPGNWKDRLNDSVRNTIQEVISFYQAIRMISPFAFWIILVSSLYANFYSLSHTPSSILDIQDPQIQKLYSPLSEAFDACKPNILQEKFSNPIRYCPDAFKKLVRESQAVYGDKQSIASSSDKESER